MPPHRISEQRAKAGKFGVVKVVANLQDGLYVTDRMGKKLQVFAANIALRAGNPPIMQLNLVANTFSVEGVPTFLVQDPMTGQPKPVRRIEWADGSVAEFPVPTPTDLQMQQPTGGAPTADPAGASPITPKVNG